MMPFWTRNETGSKCRGLAENLLLHKQSRINYCFFTVFIPNKIKGKVSLYRPSNKKLDFETSISLSNPSLLIPKSNW
jgi:hypothetical protein